MTLVEYTLPPPLGWGLRASNNMLSSSLALPHPSPAPVISAADSSSSLQSLDSEELNKSPSLWRFWPFRGLDS